MQIHHIGFEVVYLDEAVHFFKDQLKMQVVKRLEWQGEQLIFLKDKKGQLIEIVEGENFDWHIAFYVKDIQKWIDQSKSKILEGPYHVLDGKTVFIQGDDDHWFEVCSFHI